MYKYITLVLCVLAVSRGAPLNDDQPNDSSEEAYASALIKFNDVENEMLPSQKCSQDKIVVSYKLYTRENPNGHKIDPKNEETLKNSSFNVKDATKILIHEWLKNETDSYIKDFVSAYLKNKMERVNVITVDYGSVSRCGFKIVRSMQPLIGEEIGKMLKSLMQYGTVAPKLHLIGFGMGAQIAGYAARQIHPRKVGRLTALDPTFIGFMDNNPQLLSNDSDYMDVIHTAQRKFDSVRYLGNARFYPNDGSRQPIASANASKDDKEISVLSHIASAIYYLESIVDFTYFKARKCQDYLQYVRNKCSEPAVYNYMGEEANIKLQGNFYLQTDTSLPPFGKRPIDVKVHEPNRQMEVRIREVIEISAPEATSAKQTYEKKRISEQPYSVEDIQIIINQYSLKTH